MCVIRVSPLKLGCSCWHPVRQLFYWWHVLLHHGVKNHTDVKDTISPARAAFVLWRPRQYLKRRSPLPLVNDSFLVPVTVQDGLRVQCCVRLFNKGIKLIYIIIIVKHFFFKYSRAYIKLANILNTNKIVPLNHKNASFLLKFNKLVLKSKIV